MADTPQPTPPSTPEKVISGSDNVVEEVGNKEGLDAASIKQAQEQLRELNKNQVIKVTRSKLEDLSKSIVKGGQAVETNQEKIDRVLLITLRAQELERFKDEVLRAGHDFKGQPDSTNAETLAHPVYLKARELIETVYANVNYNPYPPLKFYKEWMGHATDIMVTEIASWNNAMGSMDANDVQHVVDEKMYDRNKGGIGTFEEWFKATHEKEFNDWQKTTGENAKQKTEVDASRGKVVAKASDAERRIGAIPTAVLPTVLAQRVADLKTGIGSAPDATKLAEHDKALDALAVDIGELEKIKTYAENQNFPESAKAARDEIVNAVRDGKKTPTDGSKEIEALANTPEPDPDEESQGTVSKWIDKKPGEGWGEWLKRKADEQEPGSKWKAILGSIAGFVMGFAVKAANWPIVGNWVRGQVVSNETLAKSGDERAKLFLTLESKLSEFGLSKKIATKIGDMKVSDFVKEVKAGKLAKNDAEKEKLTRFATQIEARGGATQEASILQFINSTVGKGVTAKTAPISAPTVPPAVPPQAATAPAPTTAPVAPTAPAPAPTVPAAPTPAAANPK